MANVSHKEMEIGYGENTRVGVAAGCSLAWLHKSTLLLGVDVFLALTRLSLFACCAVRSFGPVPQVVLFVSW